MSWVREFSIRNRRRCESINGFNHPLQSWSLSDWFLALFGELGEAANLGKKLNRVRDGIPGNREGPTALRVKMENEIADAYVYLDLLCQREGIDLQVVVERVFTAKSSEIGYVE